MEATVKPNTVTGEDHLVAWYVDLVPVVILALSCKLVGRTIDTGMHVFVRGLTDTSLIISRKLRVKGGLAQAS